MTFVISLWFIDPIFRLLVLGIINLLGGIDGGLKAFQKTSSGSFLVVDTDSVGVVRTNDQRVQVGLIIVDDARRSTQVLLLIFTRLGVMMAKDEVDLRRGGGENEEDIGVESN